MKRIGAWFITLITKLVMWGYVRWAIHEIDRVDKLDIPESIKGLHKDMLTNALLGYLLYLICRDKSDKI